MFLTALLVPQMPHLFIDRTSGGAFQLKKRHIFMIVEFYSPDGEHSFKCSRRFGACIILLDYCKL